MAGYRGARQLSISALRQQMPFAGFASSKRAKPQGGDIRSRRIESYRDVILGVVEEQVDITLVELAEMLRSKHGAVFAPSTIWRLSCLVDTPPVAAVAG